jgi:AhpD family alkylhydroperoxidase
MTQRIDAARAAPETFAAMLALSEHVKACGLDRRLVELCWVRASILNGCAHCIHTHGRAARALGEREERLQLLAAWRESSAFTARERAALAWTDALTLLAGHGVPDQVYADARAEFDEADLTRLTAAIGMINVWNRLAVAFRYQHPRIPAGAVPPA